MKPTDAPSFQIIRMTDLTQGPQLFTSCLRNVDFIFLVPWSTIIRRASARVSPMICHIPAQCTARLRREMLGQRGLGFFVCLTQRTGQALQEPFSITLTTVFDTQ